MADKFPLTPEQRRAKAKIAADRMTTEIMESPSNRRPKQSGAELTRRQGTKGGLAGASRRQKAADAKPTAPTAKPTAKPTAPATKPTAPSKPRATQSRGRAAPGGGGQARHDAGKGMSERSGVGSSAGGGNSSKGRKLLSKLGKAWRNRDADKGRSDFGVG